MLAHMCTQEHSQEHTLMEVHTHRRAHTCEHPDGLPSAGDGDQHQHTEAKDVASVTAALGREGAGQCKDSAGQGAHLEMTLAMPCSQSLVL